MLHFALFMVFVTMIRAPARPTLFPYTTLFRSVTTHEQGDSVSILLALPRIAQWPKTTTSSPLVVTCPATGRTSSHTSARSEEHTSELQSLAYLVCRLLLEKKKLAVYHTICRRV